MSTWRYQREPLFKAESELINLDDLERWIIAEDDDVLVIDKPGWVVCHPSKNGPLSSLIGACRERSKAEVLHLVSRLDRETSGLIVIAKHYERARLFQMAMQERAVDKRYIALLQGEMTRSILVDQPLDQDLESPVYVKQIVRQSEKAISSKTQFTPLIGCNGFTLATVTPMTGRKHQIRAHAEYLQHAIVGDKIYGGDPSVFLEFAEYGWTDRLEKTLDMRRQALHCAALTFRTPSGTYTYTAPLAWDMVEFCQHRMGLSCSDVENLVNNAKEQAAY